MKKIFSFALMCAAMLVSSQVYAGVNESEVMEETANVAKDGDKDFDITEEPLFGKAKGDNYFCMAKGLGLGLGFVGTLGTPDDMKTNMDRSIEVDWDIINLGYKFKGNNSVSLGLGLLWRNYRMTNDKCFWLDSNKEVKIANYGAGTDGKFSRLHSFSLTLPVLYRHAWNSGWNVTAGAEMQISNLKSKYYSVKTRIDAGEIENTSVMRGVKFNPFTVNAIACAAYKHVGLYVRYSPMDILDNGYGPSFQSISVGFRLIP